MAKSYVRGGRGYRAVYRDYWRLGDNGLWRHTRQPTSLLSGVMLQRRAQRVVFECWLPDQVLVWYERVGTVTIRILWNSDGSLSKIDWDGDSFYRPEWVDTKSASAEDEAPV